MSTIIDLAELTGLTGQHLGYSEWRQVTQDQIDTFAGAADDHQWIHVDPERAKSGPFRTTIAHGYLTLALIVPMWGEVAEIRGARMAINYGLNEVRFPAPVRSGTKIRLSATLAETSELPRGVEALVDAVIEREGSALPACTAQVIYRYYA